MQVSHQTFKIKANGLETIHVTLRFLLGTRTNALRYINQFTEIFTEEGRKNVKITHRVPNQQPRVTFTAGMRATMTAVAQAAQASESPASAAAGQPAGSQAGAGGAPQAAILQSRALVTPPVTVVGQVRFPLSKKCKMVGIWKDKRLSDIMRLHKAKALTCHRHV